MTTIVLFRGDSRLTDNPALHAAGIELDTQYSRRVVDLRKARFKALATYHGMRHQ